MVYSRNSGGGGAQSSQSSNGPSMGAHGTEELGHGVSTTSVTVTHTPTEVSVSVLYTPPTVGGVLPTTKLKRYGSDVSQSVAVMQPYVPPWHVAQSSKGPASTANQVGDSGQPGDSTEIT